MAICHLSQDEQFELQELSSYSNMDKILFLRQKIEEMQQGFYSLKDGSWGLYGIILTVKDLHLLEYFTYLILTYGSLNYIQGLEKPTKQVKALLEVMKINLF